jgi:DNA polymerase I-like protein with 3'-5' exonuclease and polymerase domains
MLKQFLLYRRLSLLEEMEVVRISMSLWKEKNEGEYLNIQSKKHLGEIAFKYMGIKPLTQTKKVKINLIWIC